MLRRANFLWFFVGIVALRLISMAWVPLADTSEPRYAEIARLMMETNDWITPWFEPGVPFWGKPPLSFWAQALSFKLFGVNELAVRLPSWLATLGTVFLLWKLAMAVSTRRVAQNTLIIYATSALVYIASGAVLTDPFLALGTTWAMAAFFLAKPQSIWYWRYGFFLGLSIGLLAKGPLALVLIFAPLSVWCLLNSSNRQNIKALPWLSGTLLTLVISLPWYIAAEIKTPGFINYFIVGEHFMRFIDPGWSGDLYGSAHQQAKGMIWLQWFMASFPWGIIGLALLVSHWRKPLERRKIKAALASPVVSYLVLWSLVSPVFFTPAGNILWTYLLPSLAAFALLLALGIEGAVEAATTKSKWLSTSMQVAPLLTPAITVLILVVVVVWPGVLKTEQHLVAFAVSEMPAASEMPDTSDVHQDETIYYLETKLPFSARFYSRGNAKLITIEALLSQRLEGESMFLAIPKSQWQAVSDQLGLILPKLFENRRYILVDIPATEPSTQRPEAAENMQTDEHLMKPVLVIVPRDGVHDA